MREVVDPLDMVIDWQNAIAWMAGEPQCDPDRIGLWGSSLSGGLGELGYPAPGANTVAHLIGAPIRYQFASWFPVEEIDRIPNCATQFVVAEKDELVDNKTNGIRAYERAKGRKNLVSIPGIDHYGIYYVMDARNRARLGHRVV